MFVNNTKTQSSLFILYKLILNNRPYSSIGMKISIKQTFITYKSILLNTIDGFIEDKGMKLSAALAYNTIFSLGPLFFIVIFIAGNVLGQAAIEGRIFEELQGIVGDATAEQIQNIVIGLKQDASSTFVKVISIVALIFGSTGVFTEIQDSLNLIWGVRIKKSKSILSLVLTRVLSFALIIGLGILLIASLFINTLVVGISENFLELLELNKLIPAVSKGLLSLVNNVFVFFVLSLFFAVVFKILPDVKIKWRQIWPGAFLTSVLFMFGKYLIGIYITMNKMATLYGAASSVIVLLMWVYFSAVILYIGAEFTRAYIEHKNGGIQPSNMSELDKKRLI